MNAIFFACYLPSVNKTFVVQEIIESFSKVKDATIYVGVQFGSILDTERIIKRLAKKLCPEAKIHMNRVARSAVIDSDASAFITALQLYANQHKRPTFQYCYFVHTKSITTCYHGLRTTLLKGLFELDWSSAFENPAVGAFGPVMTVANVEKDIAMMDCVERWYKGEFVKKPLEFYYLHTYYVMRGSILAEFINNVDPLFFKTRIINYSDRYFMERDFIHIVDMLGYLPAYGSLAGNYSTNFVAPSPKEFEAKVHKWLGETK